MPEGLIEKITVSGTRDQCRQRIDEYRRAGITEPIIFPATSGAHPKEQAMEVIRACAPE